MKMSVIGVGYLGAVHAASMAKLGHDVVGIDIDADRVAALNEGRSPFFEPGFDELLSDGISSGTLRFTTDWADLTDCRVHFLALGTPQKPDSNSADLSYIQSALASLTGALAAAGASGGGEGSRPLIVGKSTVPVGTARKLRDQVADHADLMWNPEFLREGFAVQDTLTPDRLVYGVAADDETAPEVAILDEVYRAIIDTGVPRFVYGLETSELVKVSANAFLATKISFINAIAEVCEATGGDVTQVAEAIGADERIGSKFLRAGLGFGGGCLPKDIRAFMARAEELNVGEAVGFLREIDAINIRRRERVLNLARLELQGDLAGKRVTVLGAAFKPNSDDTRDSPALDVAHMLHREGAKVTVTDPQAIPNARRRFPELTYVENCEEAMIDAELVILGTEWARFRELSPTVTMRLVHPGASIIDARNVLDPAAWRAAGWVFHALGRMSPQHSFPVQQPSWMADGCRSQKKRVAQPVAARPATAHANVPQPTAAHASAGAAADTGTVTSVGAAAGA
ncbi:UDP-glucose dehydrogenase family protein [Helcobacillus massiliensis]|uniref:UDP-glucose dehydrogenase family protein n=1 Tax=Helcobacillus massiliensis TaxID=521392 RepID=UPI00255313FB|nr:UDP-glucose/GDP-mannose dehydrogenase family protein [Helcobacillus massiliensis]MDK7741994.1 UDP-glucose/GDP-mannose dehydrogenase family protein [Helcobacillus massiliensis]WOO93095.1 UDP-glucose/GDP-mannose dehydrogenase family protein [Helcobacillus massiliensis]